LTIDDCKLAIELPVIVSASAGDGAGPNLELSLRALLAPGFEPRFLHPADLDDLRRLVADIVQSGARYLAVAGGDGTLHRVVNALGDAPVIVAPLPTGSGNDFCRGVGLTTTLAGAADALASRRTRRVDLLEVNGMRVCTVAGLGLVADVGVQAGRWLAPGSTLRPVGRALGDLTYLGGAAGRLFLSPRVAGDATIAWRDADGRLHTTRRRLHGIMLANLQTLGAGLRLPVPGQPDDGAFELVQILEGSRVKLARALSSLRSDRPVPPGTLDVAQAVEATIEWHGGSALLADGEDLGIETRFEVRVLPRALEIPLGAADGRPLTASRTS
jgi:diacylglycerol kinase (ATP)